MRAASNGKRLEIRAEEHADAVITTEQEGSPMPSNEFRQPLSLDAAPRGSVCEWGGQPAVLQITVANGVDDEEPAYFWRLCGEEFARAVADSLDRTITEGVDTYA